MGAKDGAGWSKTQGPPIAVDELSPHLLFEHLDLLRNGGLRNAQGCGGRGYASTFSDRDEDLEGPHQVNLHSIRSMRSYPPISALHQIFRITSSSVRALLLKPTIQKAASINQRSRRRQQ